MRLILALCGKSRVLCLLACLALFIGTGLFWRGRNVGATTVAETIVTAEPQAKTKQHWARAYGQLPLRFEANQGQSTEQVKFLARGSGYTLFLTPAEIVWRLRSAQPVSFSLQLLGAQPAPHLSGLEQLASRSHYLFGDDPQRWRTNVANYAKVKYEAVYPGVDLIFYGAERQLEYDFVVAPGADAKQIVLSFAGVQSLRLTRNGDLLLRLPGGEVRQSKPVAYQLINGARQPVAARYVVRGRTVAFHLGAYDKRQPLWIDPVLLYSTYLGGTGNDRATSIAVDAQGNAYVTGDTLSPDLPGPKQIQPTIGQSFDAFVLKLNASGNGVVYATYLGGNASDNGASIAVDAQGNAYVVGQTSSTNFPTKNPVQTARGGVEGFVAKLNASGAELIYSTYLGGSGNDSAAGVAADAAGNAYITGSTDSGDFPVANALQSTRRGGAFYASSNGAAAWSLNNAGLTASAVRELAVDPLTPSTVYAGTESGIFKTTNRGASWTLAPARFPGAVTAIVIEQSNSQIFYALSRNRLYKTTDGGVTVSELMVTPAPRAVWTLALDPVSATTLYAGTDLGVFKSVNGGQSWALLGAATLSESVNVVLVDPLTPTTVFAATQRGLFRSVDAGANWTVVAFPIFGAFANVTKLAIDRVQPARALYAFVNNSQLFKSVDGGVNWQLLNQSFQAVTAIVVDPVTFNNVYLASSIQGVFKSTNGGASWTASNTGLSSTEVLALALDRNNPANLYAGTLAGTDAFVVKLNANGAARSYATYLGGAGNDSGNGLAVDAAGNAYVIGTTASTDFPSVAGARPAQAANGGANDAFVAKLNAAGNALVYTTYLGGSGSDVGQSIAVNAAGAAFVTGWTVSPNFPTVNPLRAAPAAADGVEAFVAKLKADGAALDYSTYLGGDSRDQAQAIAVDATGNAWVAGVTASTNFPAVNAVQDKNGANGGIGDDAFVARLSENGAVLLFSTYLGGFGSEQGNGLALDAAGNVYVAGFTSSPNFPLLNPLRRELQALDGFVAKFGAQADLALTKTASPNPVLFNNRLT